MKIAVFSDVHSNLEACEAVLEAIEKENVDKYYCGGDIVGYGADPSACINKSRQINPTIVAGNHDWGAVGLTGITYFNQYAKEAVLWTAKMLTEADKEYLKSLELVYKKEFVMVHGSLNRPEEFEYILDFNSAHKTFLLLEKNRPICFIGHSHVAGIFIKDKEERFDYNCWPEIKLEDGKRYIVNVGSVGQPRDNDPRAAYCIYDTADMKIQIKRVKYDIKKAQAKIIKAGLPRILAERLGVGR